MKIKGIATREKQEKKKMGEIVFFFFPKDCKYKEQQKNTWCWWCQYILLVIKNGKTTALTGIFFVQRSKYGVNQFYRHQKSLTFSLIEKTNVT